MSQPSRIAPKGVSRSAPYPEDTSGCNIRMPWCRGDPAIMHCQACGRASCRRCTSVSGAASGMTINRVCFRCLAGAYPGNAFGLDPEEMRREESEIEENWRLRPPDEVALLDDSPETAARLSEESLEAAEPKRGNSPPLEGVHHVLVSAPMAALESPMDRRIARVPREDESQRQVRSETPERGELDAPEWTEGCGIPECPRSPHNEPGNGDGLEGDGAEPQRLLPHEVNHKILVICRLPASSSPETSGPLVCSCTCCTFHRGRPTSYRQPRPHEMRRSTGLHFAWQNQYSHTENRWWDFIRRELNPPRNYVPTGQVFLRPAANAYEFGWVEHLGEDYYVPPMHIWGPSGLPPGQRLGPPLD